jgi:hypothetical protein
LDPLEAVARQWQAAKERRPDAERVHRRTDIVHEPRQRHCLAARTAARCVSSFADKNLEAGPRQHDGGSQAVRA